MKKYFFKFTSIYSMLTPNINCKKFLAESVIFCEETIDIPHKKYANISPLA
jgi:hypothetical protein